MKKLLLVLLIGFGLYGVLDKQSHLFSPVEQLAPSDGQLREAFEQRRSNLQVEGSGVVAKVLRDDQKGSRHQRFILRTTDGLSLLVAHNIDLAPRVEGLSEGDEIIFFGEYEWNDKGGVIHWTHHDPQGRHVGGWLKHKGRTYQ
ncbi:DUF3465 domain-containing protein [Metapseudomonas boanensis]|uniref:DUF3465 domain-containing protein n=1 Tax=Metapseudomonas boanensis TaxID=2822138 RepID=A0ABS5XCX0_9GAMM|nr:DUF3465 domain-containing protein [Pseudomonas boanensis]MBT8765534.1 DUF3465 domain-containing protein [Pseudomonas boanensis]